MNLIEIAGKKLKLGSRMARMFALFLDGMITFWASVIVAAIFGAMFRNVFGSGWIQFMLYMGTWSAGMLFMDGFKNGQGLGKRLLSLQVIRMKDGKPCTFKDSFIRRLTCIFQPFDMLFSLGDKKQRMGDKFAETVVVKYEPYIENVNVQTEDPVKVLDNAIDEITNRLAEAREKVDASIGIEKQFQNAYEGALIQAERCEERATIAIKAGREDLAREDIAQRNEYNQLASRYKTQWDEQKQIVADLTNLLDTLKMKTEEAERKRDVLIAQHRNVDAQKHLQQTLTEVQDGAAFEILNQMEQNVSEAATLAKAASDVDSELSDTKLNREFAGYAEEASIDNDLAELKAKLQ